MIRIPAHRTARAAANAGLPFSAAAPGRNVARALMRLALALLPLAFAACVPDPPPANTRPFVFATDTLAFANQLVWQYRVDPATGALHIQKSVPPPTFALRCFVLTSTVRQFYQYAQFDPALPPVDDAEYRRIVRTIESRSPRTGADRRPRVVVPGYPDLRSFSTAKRDLMMEVSGGPAESYFQRGNWRMVLPFSRSGSADAAERMRDEIESNDPPIVHLLRFPRITINHAILLYAATDTGSEIRFSAYDPNQPERPAALNFIRATGQFVFPPTDYFQGGPLDVYEVFRGWAY